jgi:Uma2 family endonuclease
MVVRTANLVRKHDTFADVLERIGHVPVDRVLVQPAPGSATEADVLDRAVVGEWPTELIDGVLVRKAYGWRKGVLSARIAFLLGLVVYEQNLVEMAGPRGPIRLRPGLICAPDVSFICWDSVDDPEEIENPAGAFLEYPPDLVVEVLGPGNTRREMEIKLAEYAKAGVRLVWYVDPERKELDVFPKGNPKRKKTVGVGGALDGGDILPGFTLPVTKIFEKRAPAKKPGKKGKK